MKILTIAWRELTSTFTTTVGWLVLCAWLFLTGLFWFLMVSNYVFESQNLVYNPYAASYMNLTDYLLAPFFGNCAIVLVMIVPALTMRSLSEEFSSRTYELLATSPLHTAEIVLGKYLGAVGVVVVMLALTLVYPIGLLQWGKPDLGAVAGGYLGLFCLSSALLAMGMWFSSLTRNQLVALVLTVVTALGLVIVEWGSRDPADLWAQLSIMGHLADLISGAMRLSDLAYYAGFTCFFLFATQQRLESFRWS